MNSTALDVAVEALELIQLISSEQPNHPKLGTIALIALQAKNRVNSKLAEEDSDHA